MNFQIDTNFNSRYVEKYAEDIILLALTDLSDLRKWYFTEQDTHNFLVTVFFLLLFFRVRVHDVADRHGGAYMRYDEDWS